MITKNEIKSLKSEEPKEVFLMVLNDAGQTYDIIGQITRTRLWVEYFIDGIILQVEKEPKAILKKSFAAKQKHLFELGIINKNHNEDLKILNKIRNLYAHKLNPHDESIQLIKKFSSYDEIEKTLENTKDFPSQDDLQKYRKAMENIPYYNEIKNRINFFDNPIPTMIAGGAFGLISFYLTFYIFTVFLNPKTNS
ncbi:MAG: hypothetical protein OEM28_11205 [Nitrosopumilus sp.]|nr:hypothetical protein [Nitrosopumilus sp.]